MDTGNGEIRLTATVNGIMPYIPTGKITFTWSDQTYDAILSGGTAVHQISGAEAKTYTYKAEYIPAADDSYYAASSSAEKTIVPAVGTNVTVTFNVKANGGLFDNGSQEDNVLSGAVSSTLKLPAVKERDGFTFNGWWTEPAGGVKIGDPAVFPAANVVYYAQWIEKNKLKVSFDPGSGKWQDGTAEVKNVSVSSGESVNIPGTVTREGYQFVGWKIDGTGHAYTAEEIKAMKFTADTRFVAEYKIKTTGGSAGGSGGSAGGGSHGGGSSSGGNGGNNNGNHGNNNGNGNNTTKPNNPSQTGVADWLRTDEHNSYITGYGNGLFGPENSVTRAQIAQIFYRLLKDQNVTATVNFSDVKSDAWYAEAVNALGSMGIISGVGKGKFDPDRAITRAEFCAVAARFAKVNSSADCPFDDVNTRDWYYQAVATAASYGWVTGMRDGSFHPNNVISRAQAATIINRMLGAAADRDFVDSHVSNPYKDVSPSYWAYYQIIEASIPHNHSYNAENVEIWNGLK